MARLLNDGSENAPRIKSFLNLDTLLGLRTDTALPKLDGAALWARLRADGFDGVQLTTSAPVAEELDLPYCGLDRIHAASEADAIVRRHKERGDLCLTVHVGWGMEDDDEAYRLVDAVLTASERNCIPVFIETHRATITQDLWRTVEITRRFPEVLFNADLSHYYCGQELAYGDWTTKVAFMQPIFDRTAFMHGRVASPGCMQVPIGRSDGRRPLQSHGAVDYLQHFRDLWTRACAGFLRRAGAGDVLIFAPELLCGDIYYARKFPNANGLLEEESDRYAESLLLREVALKCFAKAEEKAGLKAHEDGTTGQAADVAEESGAE